MKNLFVVGIALALFGAGCSPSKPVVQPQPSGPYPVQQKDPGPYGAPVVATSTDSSFVIHSTNVVCGKKFDISKPQEYLSLPDNKMVVGTYYQVRENNDLRWEVLVQTPEQSRIPYSDTIFQTSIEMIASNGNVVYVHPMSSPSKECNESWITESAPVPQAGIANPASVNCQKVGGNLVIKTGPNGGQYGLCYFEDNRACEEWALLRGDCPVGGVKTTGFDTDAQSYCAWSGGKTLAVPNAVCTFTDGSTCLDDAFYNGTCQRGSNIPTPTSTAQGADGGYTVEKTLTTSCTKDADCTTPNEYLLMSRCPFTSKCIEKQCAVVCPHSF